MNSSSSATSLALDTTCFNLGDWEHASESHLQHPTQLCQGLPDWLPAVPTVCLARSTPGARLEGWRLAGALRLIDEFTPEHIIGAVIRMPRGRTSPIAAIDPATRRVRTESGSVYELGLPDPLFCRAYPAILHCLGF